MKLLKSLSLAIVALAFFACDPESPNPITKQLNHDSSNLDSPNLPPDTWQVAARFTDNETSQYSGDKIEYLEYYIYNKPDSAWVAIYEYGNGSEPGTLLYSSDVTNSINTYSWNTHTLTTDVTINGGIWMVFGYEVGETKQVIGCDAGPAVTGGDLLTSGSSAWSTMFQLYSASINWNIRAIIAE